VSTDAAKTMLKKAITSIPVEQRRKAVAAYLAAMSNDMQLTSQNIAIMWASCLMSKEDRDAYSKEEVICDYPKGETSTKIVYMPRNLTEVQGVLKGDEFVVNGISITASYN